MLPGVAMNLLSAGVCIPWAWATVYFVGVSVAAACVSGCHVTACRCRGDRRLGGVFYDLLVTA